MTKKRRGTKTASFGSTEKISHDSSKLYDSRIYDEVDGESDVPYVDNSDTIPKNVLDTVILGDSQYMDKIPDNSVHLMITSPPYNVTKEYDDDMTLSEYLGMLKKVFTETWRVLVTGGRACINIANVGRKPFIPLDSYIDMMMMDIGFLMRGKIVWDKGMTANSMAWGSFKSPSNPVLRDTNEYILIYSKQKFGRDKTDKKATINKKEFIAWTRSIWQFSPESARKIGHPAPFPEELPRRLIELYSFEGDIILDPFMGSGTTGLASLKCNRHFLGYEREERYLKLAMNRVKKWKGQTRMNEFFS